MPQVTIRPVSLNTDLEATDAPDQWQVMTDVAIRDQRVEKAKGYQLTVSADFLGPSSFGTTSFIAEQWLLFYLEKLGGGSVFIYSWDGTTKVQQSAALLDPDAFGSSFIWAELDGRPILSGNTSGPVFAAQAVHAVEPWAPFDNNWPLVITNSERKIVRSIRVFKNFLIGMNWSALEPDPGVDESFMVRWSDAWEPGADPTIGPDWLPAPDNLAGDALLGAGVSGLVDGGKISGDQFMIYGDQEAWLMQFIGGNNIFQIRKVFSSVGLANINCIAQVKRGHVVLTRDDVVFHNGVEARSIASLRVRKAIFDDIRHENSFVQHYVEQSEVWFFISNRVVGAQTTVWVWNYAEDAWSRRRVTDPLSSTLIKAGTEFGFVDERYRMVVAHGQTGDYAFLDEGTDQQGVPFAGVVETQDHDLGDSSRIKTVTRLWPKLTGAASVNISIAARDRLTDPLVYGTPVEWNAAFQKVDIFATGRYFSFKFEDTGTAADWQMTEFKVEFQPRGTF